MILFSAHFREAIKKRSKGADEKVLGFVRVGSWVYPLLPSVSPAMKTTFNAYIFPNEDEEKEKSNKSPAAVSCNFVGLTFANVSKADQEIFEDILANYGSLIYQSASHPSGVKQPTLPPVISGASTATAFSSVQIQAFSATAVATSSSQGQGEKSNSKIVSYDKQSDKLTNYIVEEPDE